MLCQHLIGRDASAMEFRVSVECPNMERMLSVCLKGCNTLFSIHGVHYTKVNMRYAMYAAYKI